MIRSKLFYLGISCLAWTATVAPAQTKPTFEVASVKPTSLDMAKLAAQMQSGGAMPRVGPRFEGGRAEFIFLSLRDLIVLAYKVKPYQITGPNWLNGQRFDIMATVPEGATKDDIPQMLQALPRLTRSKPDLEICSIVTRTPPFRF